MKSGLTRGVSTLPQKDPGLSFRPNQGIFAKQAIVTVLNAEIIPVGTAEY